MLGKLRRLVAGKLTQQGRARTAALAVVIATALAVGCGVHKTDDGGAGDGAAPGALPVRAPAARGPAQAARRSTSVPSTSVPSTSTWTASAWTVSVPTSASRLALPA
jgi:hypothetical protein